MTSTHVITLLLAGCATSAAGPPPSRPDIVVMVADDLGYGDVGCYGGTLVPTPNIDRLAQSGVRFTDGYVVAPVCGPSRVGLLSGAYPQRFGLHWNQDQWSTMAAGMRLPENHLTLPETLREAGYATGHLGKWNFPRDARQCCDLVDDLMDWGGGYFPNPDGSYNFVNDGPRDKNYVQGLWGPVRPGEEYLTDRIGRHAVEFIERQRGCGKPFFLYLGFNAPHSPYQAKESLRARFGSIRPQPLDSYAAMVASLDENVGRVLDKLRDEGLLDNSIVVFISDNGPAPPLKDGWKPEWPQDLTVGSAGPLSGRKAQFFEGGIRVPFLAHWPARLKPGACSRAVSALDLYPTLCAAAGAAPSSATRLDGVDLLPFLLGEQPGDPRPRLFWGKQDDTGGDRVQGAVREGSWKLVIQFWKPKLQLFDLASDPAEQRDLAAEQPEHLARLHQAWLDWNSHMLPPASLTARTAKKPKPSPPTAAPR